jgi:hypothetical protein
MSIYTFGQTIFTQNFEGSWTTPPTLTPAWSGTTTPADNVWHRNDYTTLWTSATGSYSPTGANSTTYSARFHTYDAATASTGDLITPVIDISAYAAGAVVVKFFYINTSGTDVLNIYSSTDGGTTWSAALRPALGVAAVWTEYTISIPGNSATTKIKLTATSDYGTTDIGIDEFRVLNPIIPAPPVSFTVTGVAQGGMTIGWTDNSTNETGFRLYRSIDGITYAQVGADITSTSVATTGVTYSQAQTGLLAGTTYYYRIAAFTDAESAYLTGSQTTLPPIPKCGTKNVGPTGDYLSLTDAFTDLGTNGISCSVNLVLQAAYASTVETFPVTVGLIPGTSPTNKISVYPSTTGLSITSSNAAGTINLNGAKYVIFDGRVNATGSAKDLIIENSSLTGYTFQLINGASFNAIQYCVVKGASTATTTGIIAFQGTTGISGNSNNLVDNCEIRDGVSSPIYGIYSSGSASLPAFNSNNTVSNCLIHDFYAAAGGNPLGIGLVGGSTAWTISGNSFYMTTAKSPTVAVGYNVIFIASGDGFTINNNYIGGSAPNCGGTAWTLNGNGTPPTISNFIYAIRFAGGLIINPSTVQGNTIANISLFTSPASSGAIEFVGLLSVVGIENISNNVIGSATGTGSISVSVGNGAFSSTYEGIDFRGFYGNITNNTFGSFTITGATGSTSTLALTVRPFGMTPTIVNGTTVFSGNLAGSLTTANSIQTAAMAFPPVQIQGAYIAASGSCNMSVINNTVANINNLSAATGSHIVGIYSAGTGYPNVLSGNTIRDLNTTSINTTITGLSSLTGIYSANNVPGSVIRSNNIYNLTNTTATANVTINGMYLAHTAGNLLVEKNFIRNVGLSTSSATAQVDGLLINGSGCSYRVKNNMIQLGVNPDGSANTSSCVINGIYESNAAADSVLNNSIYIGGAPAAGVTGNTYAFNSVITPSLTVPRFYLNNIFYNSRSGGTTGKHYGIKIAGTTYAPLGLISNYNLILANGAIGGTFGYFNSLDQATFAAYKGATGTEMASGSADPNFVAPNGATATANLHVASPTPVEGAGLALANLTEDFDGADRSGLTPTDVGADAGSFTLSADVFGPNISYVAIGNGNLANRVLTNWATITDNVGVSTGASLPRVYFKKSTDADVFGGNTSADNGWKYVTASNSSSPFSFTVNYGIINGGSVAAGDVIQYFVVAQDAANNLSSNYLMAGASANPPVQNINAKPTTVQSYTIVAASIPLAITVPGTYPTLTGAGGAFDMINQGVLAGNTTINITADLTEPGTIALNTFSEDVPGANYTLTIKPDASSLRTISGTAVATGVAMIRTNGASRFTIDGGAGKLLTFRNTNATAANTGPTIQFNGGSQSCFLKNSTIENNGTTATYGSVNIGSTGTNIVEINGNDIRDAIAGTAGVQSSGIYNATVTNSIKVINNNIYNFKNYGVAFTTVADGAVITGNSFYYNSATASTATQYCIYLVGSTNGHTISNNYIGGSAPLSGGTAWTNSTTFSTYGIYSTLGIVAPSTISGNTVQNFSLTNVGSASFYGIYVSAGMVSVLNNTVGSSTVLNSISSSGTGSFYGIYLVPTAIAPNYVQGNTISGISYSSTTNVGTLYFLYLSTGYLKVGTTSPNIIGSATTAGAITYAGTGTLYGIYNSSPNPANSIENNIVGNFSLTGTTGSPYVRCMYIYSANVKKNKIFNISCANAGLTPNIYGIYNYGASGVINEYSNNLVSLDGGAATNPTIYGFYDASYSTSFYNLYFNSINISGAATGTSSTYAYYRSVAALYTMNNNIFANSRAAGGTGKHYAVYSSVTGGWNPNYNDLYSVAGPLGYYNAADQTTLAAWKTSTGGDANSLNVDPQFVSSSDLHTTKVELNNAGTNIPAVTTDYAGVTRSNPPDIGAYEFNLTPVIITVAATSVTSTSAVLNGSALANNENVATSFEYGLTTAYGTPVAAAPSSVTGSTTTAISASLAGLPPNTLYHYRAKGLVGATPYYGADMTFSTPAILPTVTTNAATTVTSTGAVMNGTVNANNASTVVTFEYGLTTAYGTIVTAVPSPVAGMTNTSVSYTLAGLVPNTTYHFRVNGVNIAGTANGLDLTFTTPAILPVVVTDPATLVTGVSATLNGTVNANNASTVVTFEYGTTIAYGTSVTATPSPVTGVTNTAVTYALSGLTPNTTYHFRAVGVNSAGTANGADLTFTTTALAPTVVTTAATPIGSTTATLNGTVNANNQSSAVTFEYGLTIAYGTTLAATPATVTGYVVTNVSAAISGLALATTYHYRAVAVNGTGTTNGNDMTFTTGCVTPVAAGTITGPASVCQSTNGVAYSVGAITDATSYVWTLPAGATIATGSGTNSITVDFSGSAASGNISVYGSSGCASGASSSKAITLNARPVPVITGAASACVGSTGNSYSTAAAMTGYTWTVSAGGTITAGAGTNAVSVTWNTAGAQTVSVNYTNASSCNATTATVKSVTVNPLPVPTITGLASACVGTAGVVYTTEAAMTGYAWTISAGGAITAGAGTNAITVTWNTAGAQNVYVNYVNGNGCTATTPVAKSVTVNTLPVPTITGLASACIGATGVIYTTEAAMTGYTWTVSAGGTITAGSGTNAITVTWSTVGAKTVSVNYTNANTCTAASATVKNVTVNPLPVPTITGQSFVCNGSTGVAYTTETGMTGYAWTVSAGGTITAGAGTSAITVTWNTTGAKTVTVNYVNTNGCTALTPATYSVTVGAGTTPTITGTASLCAGATGVIYTTQPGFNNYVWSISYGGIITAGLNSNQVTVNWATAGSRYISVNYENTSGCSAITPYTFNVTVLSVPVPIITGNANLCQGTTGVVYTTDAYYTGYTWTISAGGTITAGAGTNAITVSWNTGGSQSVSVNYTNALGCTAIAPTVYNVTVNPKPATAGTITGTTPVCAGTQGVVYTVAAIANATSYTWTIPAGVTIVSGGSTNAITVNFAPTATTGIFKVLGVNDCGNGTSSPNYSVVVNPIPVTPVITQHLDTLTSSANTGNQWYRNGVAIAGATGKKHIAVYVGTYTVVVTLNGCSSAPSNGILVLPVSLNGIEVSQSFEVYPNPNHGQFNIKVVSGKLVELNIEIYNNLGALLWKQENVNIDGTFTTPVTLNEAPAGVYMVALRNKDMNIVRKVVILK